MVVTAQLSTSHRQHTLAPLITPKEPGCPDSFIHTIQFQLREIIPRKLTVVEVGVEAVGR